MSTALAKERERESILFEPIDVSFMSSMPGEIPGLLAAMGFLDCFAVPLCCTVSTAGSGAFVVRAFLSAPFPNSRGCGRAGAGGTSFCP